MELTNECVNHHISVAVEGVHESGDEAVSVLENSYPLTVLYSKKPKTKVHGAKGKQAFDPLNYWYVHHSVPINGIHSLSANLFELATLQNFFVIRGELRPEIDPTKLVRATSSEDNGKKPYFKSYDNGLPWVCIDVDHIDCPEHINFPEQPDVAVAYVVKHLPSYFHGVSYHYQLSGSAGMGSNKIKVHLWFWLDHSVHDAVLKKWAKQYNDEAEAKFGFKVIDDSLFVNVHLHYTGNAIFSDGKVDPFPTNRSGFVQGKVDEVPFPDIVEMVQTTEVEPVKHIDPADYSDANKFGVGGKKKFELRLAAIGDHEGGNGFYKAIRSAICSYAAVFGQHGSQEHLKALLKAAIASADASAHAAGYTSRFTDIFLEGEIERGFNWVAAQNQKIKLTKGVVAGVEPHHMLQDIYSVSDATKMIRGVTAGFPITRKITGLKAAAGSGKSREAKKVVASTYGSGLRWEIYVPTYKNAIEWSADLAQANPNLRIQVIGGRGNGAIDWNNFSDREIVVSGATMCIKAEIADIISKASRGVYHNLCYQIEEKSSENITKEQSELEAKKQKVKNNLGLSPEDKEFLLAKLEEWKISDKLVHKCQYFDSCSYLRQWYGDWDVRILTHAYLPLSRSILDKDLPDFAVIDEMFYKVLLYGVEKHHRKVSFKSIKHSGWPQKFIDLLVNAPPNCFLLKSLRDGVGEDTLMKMLDDAIKITRSRIDKVDSLVDVPIEYQKMMAEDMRVKSNLETFLDIMKTELITGRDNSYALEVEENGFSLLYRKAIERLSYKEDGDSKVIPTLMIDADLDQTVINQFFSNVDYFKVNIQKNARVFQCYSTQGSKRSLTTDSCAAKRLEDTQNLIYRLETGGKRVAVVGQQVITGNAKKKIDSKLKVSEQSALLHYNALRGLNDYENFDAIIIVGRVEPSCRELQKLARALYYDHPEWINVTDDDLVPQLRGYLTSSGFKLGVRVRAHSDPKVQALLELVRESEVLQAIDRLRLVHNKKRKDVYILTNLPLPNLMVTHLLDWSEIIRGSTKLTDAFNLTNGVMPLGKDWLAANCPSVFTENGAKKYLQAVGVTKPELLNALIVDDATAVKLFEYTVSGSFGKPRKCISVYELKETKLRLSALLGTVVTSISEVW